MKHVVDVHEWTFSHHGVEYTCCGHVREVRQHASEDQETSDPPPTAPAPGTSDPGLDPEEDKGRYLKAGSTVHVKLRKVVFDLNLEKK